MRAGSAGVVKCPNQTADDATAWQSLVACTDTWQRSCKYRSHVLTKTEPPTFGFVASNAISTMGSLVRNVIEREDACLCDRWIGERGNRDRWWPDEWKQFMAPLLVYMRCISGNPSEHTTGARSCWMHTFTLGVVPPPEQVNERQHPVTY
jgi:hypothetical protein